MGGETYDEWRAATHTSEVVRGMLEDYCAELILERADEEADRATERRIELPWLVRRSLRDELG